MKRLILGLLLAASAWLQTASADTCQAVIAPWLAQANDANDKEQPAVSLPLFQRSVAACRAAHDRAGIATGLLGVGQSLHMLNRYAESELALLEGWAIRQALDDGDPRRESMYYPSELMYLYRQWSRFDLAWQWGDVALAAKARLIGKDTVAYGTSLSNLSGVALQTKEYARGLPYAQLAMQTWARTSGENSTDHAWGMRDVGVLLLRMGRMEEAYGYLERAYRIRLAAFGENRTETQTSVTDMANWHTLSGNDRQALAFAQRALAMAVQRSGADSMQASVALNRLSGIHLRLGESGKAWQEAEDGLRIRRALFGDRHANTVSAWQDVALTALADNQLGRAEVAAAAALAHCRAVYGEAAATCAAHQLAHGSARMALGQYQQALEAAQAAARLAMSGVQALPADEADALLLAAQAQAALGRQDEAAIGLADLEARLLQTPPAAAGMLDTVRQARLRARAQHAGIGAAELQALAREAGAMAQQLAATRGAAHPAYAQALLDAAGLNARAGDAATARSQSARALAIGMANEQTMLEARAAAQLGALEPDAAGIFLGKQAVNALQATRAGTASLPVPLRQGFVRQKRAAYGQLADRLLDQRRIHEAETVLAMVREDEFHSLVRSAPDPRATRLGYTGAEGEWQRQFEARAAALRAGAQALAAARERQAQGVAQADDAWRQANEAMALLLDGATEALATLPMASLASVAKPAPAGKAGMARAEPLKRGVLHLTYLLTETRLRIVAQRGGRTGSSIHDVVIDERVLAQRIARLRRSAQDPGQDARADAQALYALLLAPASRELDGATSLSLSLDGVLRYLPFAMLHDGRRWLVERLPVSLHASGGDHAGAQAAPRRAPSLALFGQTRASGELPALPFVQNELRAVQAIGHAARIPSQVYLDGDYTGAALQRALPANSSVHIASHFVLRSGAGEDSYLLLGDGGKLSLAELAQDGYRFAGLDLLTLSACETAVPAGTDATGRELEGLAWLARQRGARNVLASLWRVSDQSTATLMGDFYTALAQGKGKPQALRQAQLRQIRAARHGVTATRGLTPLDAAGGSDDARSHPFYWAGFILLGS
ncbi:MULTISPECIES: CHAT domain-containing tetratricopeptide repeat protein [unclassified Janthinobacterium]|uniref:CHAT domain-containing tetratricopeptide repeat protein n=1 Tax=unclassified Janthinobacterium TaxID=2610881 RepID=UPI0018CB688B|nr:CHAT domain-containing tetratricopeptide repeat protein [Janthinobacterium sp. CG_23.4]MDH6159093.1 CHAT domain-containing protein [Janthinobacterium sp. CG_23.4]